MTHPGGRPLKFQTVEELQAKIEGYFKSCEDEEGNLIEPYTITGLALHLGTYRNTLMNYENRDEFRDAVKTAKQKIEHFHEKRLVGQHVTGTIFALKNFGWRDSIDQNIGGQKDNPVQVEANVTYTMEEAYRRMLGGDS